MKNTALKRILAFALCLTLSVSLLPVNALAADGAEVETGALSMEGTNSVGNLLVNTLTTVEGDMTEACRVTDIRITDKTAEVKYQSDRAGELVVAVYEEDTMRMLGMGSVSVTAEDTMAAVEIDIDSMPEYFVAAAYLLDEVSHNPLCRQYVSNYYTAEFQAFLDTTVESYDSERVLNLDDDLTTNFVVFGEDTVLAEEETGVNIITDNGDGTYTIQNADERFLALQPGDSFAYTYADGEVLVVVVASAEVNGTTVLVTEETGAELADVFEYVKIEVFGGGGDAEVDMSTADPGVVYEGPGVSLDGGWYEPSFENTQTYSVNVKKSAVVVSGSVEFGYSVGAKVYVSKEWQYVSMSLDYWSKISIAITGKLPDARISLGIIDEWAALVHFTLDLALVLDASVALNWTVELKGTCGYCYDSDTGFQNISQLPTIGSRVEFGGTAFLGLEMDATFAFLLKELGNISLVCRSGAEARATHVIWESESDKQHDCNICFDGDMYRIFRLTASVSLLDDLVKSENKLADCKELYKEFYYCVDKDEFGWSTCPYIRYKVIVTVKDEDGNFRNGETILGTGLAEAPVTSGMGTAEFYLHNGSYTLKIDSNTYDASQNITVKNTKKDVTLILVEAEETASGYCGDTVSWRLYDNGFLQILGAGAMDDYTSSSQAPWTEYPVEIRKVSVLEGVTRVGNYAFYKCPALERVMLSGSVQSLGEASFYSSSKLSVVNFPEGLTDIGRFAFYCCYGIREVTIPDSVVSIGERAFDACRGLRSVGLGQGVNSLGERVFSHCLVLEEIEVASGNPYFTGEAGVLYDKGMKTLVCIPGGYSGDYTIPTGVQTIGAYALSGCKSITGVTIPYTVKTIEEGAFFYCESLQSLVVPDTVTSLGAWAFGCSGLQEITLSSALEEISECCFYDCYSLKSISVPGSVTEIGNSAFCGCGLEEIELPEGLVEIGAYAFESCTSLERVVLPRSLRILGNSAFYNCLYLETVSLGPVFESWDPGAFYGCDNLAYVNFRGTMSQWDELYLEVPWDCTVRFNSSLDGALENLDGVSAPVEEIIVPSEIEGEKPAAENEGSVPEEPHVPEAEADPTIPEMPDVTAEPEETEMPDETEMPEETTEPVGEEEPAEIKEAEALPAEVLLPAEELLIPVSLSWNGNAPLATLLATHRGNVSYDSGGFASVRLYGLVPGAEYFILLTENGSGDVLYVGQSTADEMGWLSLTCGLKRESYDVSSQAFGPSMDLTYGEILLWRDGDGGTVLLVNCENELLLEGQDFELFITENGDGTAVVTAVGRGEYGGSVTAELYAVFYDPNGGENGPEGQVQLKGQSITLTVETPVHGEQSFAGWAEDAAAAAPDYLPGDTYAGPGGTMYAVWVTPGMDVNFDGVTDVRDAAQILRYVHELPSVFGTESDDVEAARLAAADSDKDGTVTEQDAAAALARLVS